MPGSPQSDHDQSPGEYAGSGHLPGPGVPNQLSVAFGASRFGIALSIVGVALGCFAMLVYSLVVLVKAIYHAFFETSFDVDGAKHFAVDLIELTDLFLLGTVLYVVAIGMYQLFIDPAIPVPGWMRVSSLNDLKSQIINVIIVLLAVTFLGSIVDWDGETNIVYLGAALSAVIVALSLYTFVHRGDEH